PPLADTPGAVRTYVHTGPYSSRAWFDGLKAGHVFVTNGPLLELSVHGQEMGAELHVKTGAPLVLEARAVINPDIDQLDRLELFEQGEIVSSSRSRSGAEALYLRHELKAVHGTWFVVRAVGKREKPGATIVGLTAPIYVHVDWPGFCKPSAVPAIVTN